MVKDPIATKNNIVLTPTNSCDVYKAKIKTEYLINSNNKTENSPV